MADENTGSGSSAVWAVALVIIVAMIVGVVLYSGVLTKKSTTDINITAPK